MSDGSVEFQACAKLAWTRPASMELVVIEQDFVPGTHRCDPPFPVRFFRLVVKKDGRPQASVPVNAIAKEAFGIDRIEAQPHAHFLA